jgi:hypothetical protein
MSLESCLWSPYPGAPFVWAYNPRQGIHPSRDLLNTRATRVLQGCLFVVDVYHGKEILLIDLNSLSVQTGECSFAKSMLKLRLKVE